MIPFWFIAWLGTLDIGQLVSTFLFFNLMFSHDGFLEKIFLSSLIEVIIYSNKTFKYISPF